MAELSPRPDVPTKVRKLPEPAEKAKPTASPQLVPERVTFLYTPAPTQPTSPAQRPVVQPLAPARYKVQFTASAELYEKLERLEAKRFAKTKSPRKSVERADMSPKSRYIPASVRRAVLERDGNQCTYVSADGERCAGRDRLEFHHHRPFGRGGDHSPENLRLVCRTHNVYFAERDYGEEVMERFRRSGSRVSEPAAAYSIGAEGGTRTPTGRPTRPSSVRVCQFHHFGTRRVVGAAPTSPGGTQL